MGRREPITAETALIYRYRDPHYSSSKDMRRFKAVSIAPFVILLIVVIATWDNLAEGAWGIGFTLTMGCLVYWFMAYQRCHEIRLSDDGSCELETPRRVYRLHASQIKSVSTDEDGESTTDYDIKFEGGTVSVTAWPDFDDFIRRLEVLNPSLDLTDFRLLRS
jgi:hypothetical protein